MPYILSIVVSMAMIIALNMMFPVAFIAPWLVVLLTIAATVTAIAVDGLVAFLIRRLPERWFDYKRRFFNVEKSEQRFYKFIGVKKWRKLVIELGVFTNFSKSHFTDPNNPEYTARFLLESCYGVIIHISDIIVGFTVMAIYPPAALRIGLPVAIVNAVLNLLPIFVLRYNTPKIKSIHERNIRRRSSAKNQ